MNSAANPTAQPAASPDTSDEINVDATGRRFSRSDRAVAFCDRALRSFFALAAPSAAPPARPSPADQAEAGQDVELNHAERRRAAGLMRVNHAGEVCAQALYAGQALTAKSDGVREAMREAAEEELDHLAWCDRRLGELGAAPSVFNPLWRSASFALGAALGAVGDRINLGFVAATEEQVCEHLRRHLERLPRADAKSRAILEQMLEDEAAHATRALSEGGADFPAAVKRGMTAVSAAMTTLSYYR